MLWIKRKRTPPWSVGEPRQFAPTPETSQSVQLDLFNEAQALTAQALSDPQQDATTLVAAHQRKKRTPRKSLITDDLVTEVITHDLDEKEQICPLDATFLQPIGYESRRELVIIPELVSTVSVTAAVR